MTQQGLFPELRGRFVPDRLRLAREAREMTMSELAEKLGKTPSSISQFESGMTRPEVKTIAELGLILGRRPEFFAEPLWISPLEIGACYFRSMAASTQRLKKYVVANATLELERFEQLSTKIRFPHEQIYFLREKLAPFLPDVDSAAQAARKEWGMGNGPIPNVVALLETKGAFIVLVPKVAREVDAFSTWNLKRPVIALVADIAPSRTRFDCAHELGHLVMHVDVQPGDPACEKEANAFASAFLLPKDSFYYEAPTSLDWPYILSLKRRWKVSLAAILRRSFELGRMTYGTYRRASVQMAKQGYRLAEPDEPEIEKPCLLERAERLVRSDS